MPTNYIAYDLIKNGDRYSCKYAQEQKEYFIEYTNKQITKLQGNIDELKEIFLKLYANPVINAKRK